MKRADSIQYNNVVAILINVVNGSIVFSVRDKLVVDFHNNVCDYVVRQSAKFDSMRQH